MVLSRFWLTIFISSIIFVIFSLFTANSYTIDNVLNGKKDDPVMIIAANPAYINFDIATSKVTYLLSLETNEIMVRPA